MTPTYNAISLLVQKSIIEWTTWHVVSYLEPSFLKPLDTITWITGNYDEHELLFSILQSPESWKNHEPIEESNLAQLCPSVVGTRRQRKKRQALSTREKCNVIESVRNSEHPDNKSYSSKL